MQSYYFFIRFSECLEGLGKIAIVQNQLERAARLFGVAEALREKMGTPIPPLQRGDYDAHVQWLREKLGNAIEIAWSQGQAMTLDEALVYALDKTDE